MNKISFLISFFLTLLLAGCNALPSTINLSSNPSDAGAIDSLNHYYAFSDSTKILTENIQKSLDWAVTLANETPDTTFGCDYQNLDKDYYWPLVLNPSNAFDSEDREILITKTKDLISTIEIIEPLCQDLQVYVFSQDYLDDHFAYLYKMNDALIPLFETFSQKNSALLNTLDTLYEKYKTRHADIFTTPSSDNPNDQAIFNMKQDLMLATELVNNLNSPNASQHIEIIEDKYQNLKEASNTHNQADLDLKSNLQNNYDDYYENMALNFLPQIKKAIRGIKDNNDEHFNSGISNSATFLMLLQGYYEASQY